MSLCEDMLNTFTLTILPQLLLNYCSPYTLSLPPFIPPSPLPPPLPLTFFHTHFLRDMDQGNGVAPGNARFDGQLTNRDGVHLLHGGSVGEGGGGGVSGGSRMSGMSGCRRPNSRPLWNGNRDLPWWGGGRGNVVRVCGDGHLLGAEGSC